MSTSVARSSVLILDQLCNTDAGMPQDVVRSGFYALLHRAVGETVCEFGRVPQVNPQRRVNCFTVRAETSQCLYESLRSLRNQRSSTRESPLAASKGAAAFCFGRWLRSLLDRGWLGAFLFSRPDQSEHLLA